MIARGGKNRLRFMPTVSKMMVLVLTAVTLLTAAPGVGHADPGVPSATAEVSSDNTAVTVTFNTYVQPAGSLTDLLDDIKINRYGTEVMVDLAVDSAVNTINRIDETLIINLDTALTGPANSIKITAGALMDRDEIPIANDIIVTVAAHDITAPAFIGSYSNNNGGEVTLYFDENFSINLPDESTEEQVKAFLSSRISVATDGEHFVPFTDHEGGAYHDESTLYLEYYNDMKIIIGPDTVIRIASGTLKDEAGNLNEEMDLHVSPPVIQSAVVSNGNHDVEITFNNPVLNNTSSEDDLKSYIHLVQKVSGQTSSYKGLAEGDKVSVSDSNTLKIQFVQAISGMDNQILISGGALKDQNGNIQTGDIVSGFLETDVDPVDTTAPRYLDYYLSNNNYDITFVFDEDIFNALADESSFRQNVQWYNPLNGWNYTLPSDVTFTFSGPKLTMHFPAPLIGSNYYFSFYSDHFKDAAGNVLKDRVDSNWIYPRQLVTSYRTGYFSGEGRFLSLQFNYDYPLVDQTLVEGVSHLKEKITISTDNGVTYSPLDALDAVAVQGKNIGIIFHKAMKLGSIKVKVEQGVVSNLRNSTPNDAVEQTIAYITPEVTGYFFSNTDSEFVFADNAAWREKVRSVNVYDNSFNGYRTLNASEYSLSEGKLTLAKGIFKDGSKYSVMVDAEGYSSKYFEGTAYKSSEIFYMTAPVVTADNGITASIRLFNNAYNEEVNGNQTIIFELFDGTTPVSIVSANLKLDTGTYSANFNVPNAAANPNYTVKAYVVSRYGTDPGNLGLNLATVKTPLELDLAILAANQNNYED